MAATHGPNVPGGTYPPSQPPGWGPPQAQAQNPQQRYQQRPQGGLPPSGWAPASPASGAQSDEQPPAVATLLVVTLWRLAIGGAALYFASTGKEETMSSESLSYLSNMGVGYGYLALAAYPLLVGARRHEPRTAWLRGALTVMMLLVSFMFVLGMGGEPDGPHAVIPILVLVDWLFVGRSQFRTRAWEPPTWTVFLLAYLYYHQSNDVPLYDEILGEENFGTMVPLFLAGTVVMAYVLYGAALFRRAVSGSGKPASP